MALPADPTPQFQDFAAPHRLVSAQWVEDHLSEVGSADLAVVESDEDVLLYETGHIPGAVKIDWHLDLNDPLVRDYIDGVAFARLLGEKGITRETTVVIYGDKSNWWAAYALWVFTLFGHPDVRLLDGGRDLWVAQDRPLTLEPSRPERRSYPVIERSDAPIRAFREDVLAGLGRADAPALVDIRSPQEYTGERLHMPDYPEEGALRGGHIPGARNLPWAQAVTADGTFKPRPELEAIYGAGGLGLTSKNGVVTYCRIGERSSHTWFVLRYLLGLPDVRNYDGSWTEWGNGVRLPIARGDQPGAVSRRG